MPVGGPQFQFRVAIGAQPRKIIVAARKEIDSGKRLGMAAVEPFSQANDCRQHAHRAAQRVVEVPVALMRFFRGRLAMIARHQGNHFDLARIESPQISILDQVIGMAVMAVVADVHADIVEERSVFQPFAFAVSESVHATRLIEYAERKTRDLLRMLRPVPAAFAKFDDAAAADVGVALHLADSSAVAMDIVEDEALAQREIAQGQVFGTEAAQDRVEQHRAGDTEIGAARIESRHVQALFDVGGHESLAQPTQRLCGDSLIPQILRWRAFFFGERDGAEAEDGS